MLRILASVVAAALVERRHAQAMSRLHVLAGRGSVPAVRMRLGYDWEDRCYRKQGGVRLPVGGEPDKVWRTAVRFPTLPARPSVLAAELVWDVTDLVAEWTSGAMANGGALIKLADRQEDYGSGGPLFAGASHPNVSLRPRLTIWYLPQ